MNARFEGFAPDALSFFEGLEADNSKPFWQANKPRYEESIRIPLRALLAELEPEFGEFRTFRPNNDVRFSKNKTPYKTQVGSVAEGEGGAIFYVQLSAAGLMVGSGYYAMASDQLDRFRQAVDDDHRGAEVAKIGAALAAAGYRLGAISELKTAPRGYPKDHPRIELLRRKGLVASREFAPAPWLHTRRAKDRIVKTWRDARTLNDWLDAHVGPSELPPEDAMRW